MDGLNNVLGTQGSSRQYPPSAYNLPQQPFVPMSVSVPQPGDNYVAGPTTPIPSVDEATRRKMLGLPPAYVSPPPVKFDPNLDASGNHSLVDSGDPDAAHARYIQSGGTPPMYFQDYYAKAKAGKGSDLTPEEFDKVAANYRSNLEAYYLGIGTKKDLVKNKLAKFDEGLDAQKKMLLPADADATKKGDGSFGSGTEAAVGQTLNKAALGTAGLVTRLAMAQPQAILADKVRQMFGLAPMGDTIGKYISDPDNRGGDLAEFALDRTKTVMGKGFDDPKNAHLKASIYNSYMGTPTQESALATPTSTPSLAGYEAGNREALNKISPTGTTIGDVGGGLVQFGLLGPAAPAAVSAGNVLDTTARQANAGIPLEQQYKQAAVDYGLGTALNYAAPGFAGTLSRRLAVGGAAGAVTNPLQAWIDHAINPSTEEGPSIKGTATSAGWGALLAAIFGKNAPKGPPPKADTGSTTPPPPASGAAVDAAKTNDITPEIHAANVARLAELHNKINGTPEMTVPTPPGGPPGSPPTITIPAQPKQIVTPAEKTEYARLQKAVAVGVTAKPAAPQGLPTAIHENPGEGIAGDKFQKLEGNAIVKVGTEGAKIKRSLSSANATPQELINQSTLLARKYAGEDWADMTSEQRANLAATIAQRIHTGENQIGATNVKVAPLYPVNGADEAIAAIRDAAKPVAKPAAEPAVKEVAGLSASDVPGSVDTSAPPAPQMAPVAAPEAPPLDTGPVPDATAALIRALPPVDPKSEGADGPVNKLKYGPALKALGHDPNTISKEQAQYILGSALTAPQLQGILHVPVDSVVDEIHKIINAPSEDTSVQGQKNVLTRKVKAAQGKQQQAASTAETAAPLARPEPIVLPPAPNGEVKNVGGSVGRRLSKAQQARQDKINAVADKADNDAKWAPVAKSYFESFTTGYNKDGALPYFQDLKARFDKGEFIDEEGKTREEKLQDAFKEEQAGANKPLVKLKAEPKAAPVEAPAAKADTTPKMSDLLALKGKKLSKSDGAASTKAKMLLPILKQMGHSEADIGKMSLQEAGDAFDKGVQETNKPKAKVETPTPEPAKKAPLSLKKKAPAAGTPSTASLLRGLYNADPTSRIDSFRPVDDPAQIAKLTALGHDPARISKAQAAYILHDNITADQLAKIMGTTPSPKQEAPAKAEAGAQKEKDLAPKSKSLPAEQKVRLLTKGADVTPAELKDLVDAVNMAHQGRPEELRDLLKSHREAETLTPEQIKGISKLALEKPVSNREADIAQLKAQEEDAVQADREGADPEADPEVRNAVKRIAKNALLEHSEEEKAGESIPDERPPAGIIERIKSILSGLISGKSDHAQTYEELHGILNREETPTEQQKLVRDAGIIQDKLRKYSRGNPSLEASAKFGIWLLDRNPALARGLDVTQGYLGQSTVANYNPVRKLITLSQRTDFDPTTVVHEILHHMERMLPPELQAKIRAEYLARLINKYKQAAANNDEAGMKFLAEALINAHKPSYESRYIMNRMLTEKGGVDGSYLKYTNPSEYWAEEGSRIIQERGEANPGKHSWKDDVRDWYKQFVEYLKNAAGMDNNHAVLKGLREVLSGKGEQQSPQEIDSQPSGTRASTKFESEGADVEKKPPSEWTDEDFKAYEKSQVREPVLDRSAVGNSQKIVEYLANKREGIAKTVQAMYRAGIKIGKDNDIYKRFYNYEGLKLEYNYIDDAEAYDPLNNFVHSEYAKTHSSPQAYMDDVNDWYKARMWLDHSHYLWTRDVPLKEGHEVTRQDIKEQLLDGKISPETAKAANDRLAAKYGETPEREYMIKNGVPVEKLEIDLARLKKKGLDETSLKSLNDMMQPVRDRTTQRRMQAGELSKEDIRLRDSVGDKWYVPLKGPPEGMYDGQNQDIISQGINTKQYSDQIKIAEGRKSEVEKPFYRLIMDMHRAGERHAMSDVTDTIYNAMLDANDKLAELQPKLDKLRAARDKGDMTQEDYVKAAAPIKKDMLDLHNAAGTIHVYTGNLARGFTDEAGKETPTLPVGRLDVVKNDGDTHYVMSLRDNSQLLRGLVLNSRKTQPVAPVRAIGAATNVFARTATTINVPWDTLVQFPRQWTFTPMLLAAAKFDNPLKAVSFVAKNTLNNIKMLGAIRSIPARVMGDYAALKEYAAQNPDSPAAWVADYEAHGGRIGHTLGFNASNADRLFLNRFSDIDYTKLSALRQIPEAAWQRLVKYSGAYLSALDTFTRAGSYKTLVDEGVDKTTAAADVRATLDYSTAGRWSGTMNSLFAFSRTGFTSLDAARRAFTKPSGQFDYVKLGKWQAFLGAVGAGIAYPLMTALLGKDEDGKDRMAKIAPDTLTQQFVFPVGDKVIKIPIGQGLPQMILAPGMLAGAYIHGHITFKEAVAAYAETLRRNTPRPLQPGHVKGLSPGTIVASAMVGITPTLATPFSEMNANVNAFGLPIHTDHYDSKLPESEQGMKSTPQEFKDIAQWMHDNIHYDVFPEDVRYISQAYVGSMMNSIIRAAVSDRPFLDQGEKPIETNILSKAISNDEQFYLGRKLHSVLDSLQDNEQRYNTLVARAQAEGADKDTAKTKADAAVRQDPSFKQGLDGYKQLAAAQQKYYKDIEAMRKNKMISDERKQMLRKGYDSTLRKALDKAQTAQ